MKNVLKQQDSKNFYLQKYLFIKFNLINFIKLYYIKISMNFSHRFFHFIK